MSRQIVFEESRVYWSALVLLFVPVNSYGHIGTNHLQNHVVKGSAIPDHLIQKVSRQIGFEEQE